MAVDHTTRPTGRPVTAVVQPGAPVAPRTQGQAATRTSGTGAKRRKSSAPRPGSTAVKVLGRVALYTSPFLLLVLVAAIVGYVKLRHSPISLSSFVAPIETGINGVLENNMTARLDGAQLTLAADGGPEIQLTNLQLFDADGDRIAAAPLAAIEVSWGSLLTMRVVPTRVQLIEPQLNVTYTKAAGFSLDISDKESAPAAPGAGALAASTTSPAPPQPSPAPGSEVQTDRRQIALNAGRMKFDIARWLSESTMRARAGEDATHGLREVGVRDAVVVIDYEGKTTQWQVPEASVELDHRSRRSVIVASARVAGQRGPWDMLFRFEDRVSHGNIEVTTKLKELVPSSLSKVSTELGVLASLDMPVSADVSAQISRDGDVQSAKLSFALGAGRFGLPGTTSAPATIDSGLLKFDYIAGRRALELSPSTIKSGGSYIKLAGGASAVIGRSGLPQWRFDIRSQDGLLVADGVKDDGIKISSLVTNGVYVPQTGEMRLEQARLKAGSAEVFLEGDVTPQPGGTSARFEGKLTPMPVETLKSLWPAGIASGAREWFSKNVTEGRVQSGSMIVSSGPQAWNPAGSDATDRMSIALELADLKAMPMAGATPIDAPRALVRLENSTLEITVPDAALAASPQQSIALKGGRLTVVDATGPAPVAEIAFKVVSPLAAAIAVASRPPYSAVSAGSFPLEALEGNIDGQFQIKVPLDGAVTPARSKVEGKVRVGDIRLKKKIGSLELQGGTINLDVTEQALNATGDLLLNGVIATVEGQRIFDAAPDKQPPLRIKAMLDNSDRNQLGLDVNHIVQGDMPLEVTVGSVTGDMPAVHVRADLTGAELSFVDLAWRKEPGRAAFLDLDLGKGQTGAIELHNLKIAGDNVAIEGWAAINDANDLSEFYFPDFSLNVVSRLEVKGKLGNDKVWRVKAKGSVYDGKDFMSGMFSLADSDQRRVKPLRPSAGVDVDAEITNVLGHNEVSLRNFKLKMSERADKLIALSAEGTLDGGKQLLALVKKDEAGKRTLYAESADAGQAFKLAGFYRSVIAGRMRLEVNLEGKDAAAKTGILWVDNFRVLGDPIVQEVISSASKGDQKVVREVVDFDRMRIPFAAGHDQFVLDDSYVRGPIVGATVSGKVDFRTQRVDLGGTYIPLQGINSVLCAIPLLGAIITGPKCEGVLGITYAIQGSMDNPQVVVNPLSVFTPGILREIMTMTSPNQKVQARDANRNKVPVDERTGESSSAPMRGDPGNAKGTSPSPNVDGWSSQTTGPKKK